MFRLLRKKNKKGQSAVEYAVLIMIVIGAMIAISGYVKRGIQGRMKQATDDIGKQFSPGNTNAELSTTVVSSTSEVSSNKGQFSGLLKDEITKTVGSMNILNVDSEFWGDKQ